MCPACNTGLGASPAIRSREHTRPSRVQGRKWMHPIGHTEQCEPLTRGGAATGLGAATPRWVLECVCGGVASTSFQFAVEHG